MSRLEILKKQAKQILRWHRDGHYPVAAQIRELPKFHDLTDAQLLEQEFKLSDAQELVAIRSGFPGWQALRNGIETMTTTSAIATSRPRLTGAEPQLLVSSIESSCDFFTTSLGFSLAFTYGEPSFYAQVQRDAAKLNLRLVAAPLLSQDLREKEVYLSASITVDNVKQLYAEFQANGVQCHQPLRREPWGAKTFIVKDPDGNLILFAG